MEYDLIIFDLDGTLVNTEIALNVAFVQKIHELAPQEFRQFDVAYILEHCMGKTVPGIFDRMQEDAKVLIDEALRSQIVTAYQATLPEHLKSYLKPDPVLIPILENLSTQFKICVGSNGLSKTVAMSLAAAGLSDIFKQNVFTAEQVAHPKPAPDLIYYAASQMGVSDMSRVLHIEDAARGARAGITAGVKEVVGYTGHALNKIETAESLRDVGIKNIFDNWPSFAAYVLK